MEERPVAQVLEDVRLRGEGRETDPVRPLATHLGEALRGAIHPLHHVMAADAGIGARAVRNDRGRIMRTSSTEIGDALDQRLRADGVALGGFQLGQLGPDVGGVCPRQDAPGQRHRDLHWLQRALGRE